MKILVAEIINNVVAQVRVTTLEFFSSNPFRYPGEWKIVGEEYNEKVISIECGKGHLFLIEKEKFIEPKPFDSWVLDEEKVEWKSPKEVPKDGKDYQWDEEKKDWKELKDK